MQHVRVREDDVRPPADLPAPLEWRVAVVDRGAYLRGLQLCQGPRLVLRERLRGVEVERAKLRLTRNRVEHGEIEREALSGRGAGGDDDVLAVGPCVPDRALMGTEGVQPSHSERCPHAWVQVRRQRRCAGPRRRDRLHMRDLLAFKEITRYHRYELLSMP